MPLAFSDTQSVQAREPFTELDNGKDIAAHQPSVPGLQRNVDVDRLAPAAAHQSSLAELEQVEPLTVVQQTIDALEVQGLLMLFDRHDQVAKRLTGDLIAAGVLLAVVSSKPEQCSD